MTEKAITQKSAKTLDPIRLFELQPTATPKIAERKLQLKIRTKPLEEEFAGIPKTLMELHQQVLLWRQREHEAVYQGTLAYLKMLKEHPKFWARFNCSTMDQYNLRYGPGTSDTLAKLAVEIKLFEQETFVLVGHLLLSEMIREIGMVQPNPKVQRHDIERIFTRYCEQYDQFDRDAFRITFRLYIRGQYPPPAQPDVTPTATTHKPTAPQQPDEPKVGIRQVPTSHRPEDLIGPGEVHLTVKEHQCAGCVNRQQKLQEMFAAYECYISRLINAINKSGKNAPSVPKEIRGYRRLYHWLNGHQ